jgi:hypothetical protein
MHLRDTALRVRSSSDVISSSMHPLALAQPPAAVAQIITTRRFHHVHDVASASTAHSHALALAQLHDAGAA